MSKQKRFVIGAVIFYVWYAYTAAVMHLVEFCATGALYKILKISAPLTLLDLEFGGVLMYFFAPILFLAVTVIVDLLPEFTKAQKIVLSVLPVVSYSLFWIFGFFADAYFRYGALH